MAGLREEVAVAIPAQINSTERDRPVNKIRILFLIDDFLGPEGGTEQHLLFLQRKLPHDRFDLYFGVLTRVQGIPEENFPVRPVMLCGANAGMRGALRRLRGLAAFIRANQIDVVHAFSRTSELYGCLAVKLAGRGRVLGIRRNVGYWHTWRSRWAARFVARLAQGMPPTARRRTSSPPAWNGSVATA